MTLTDWALADELILELGALRLSVDETRTDPVPPTDPAVASLRATFDEAAAAIARVIQVQDDALIADARRVMAEAHVAVERARAVIQEARATRIGGVQARLEAAAARQRPGRQRPSGGTSGAGH
jgi:hypothetical protein